MGGKNFEKFKIKQEDKITEYTCNESELANFFGANPNAPHFLTHVFFKKEVLDKYYNKPSKYSVVDGYLSEGSKWGINIDNNTEECIIVYLGDLGRLPYEEQQYWKLHNITEGKISQTSFKRNIQAEFCSPTEPALVFKEKLGLFNGKWMDKFNWDLFRPLNEEDKHNLKILKIPDNEQKEFDEVVLSLNKIIIDSLNISEMKKDLTFESMDNSITILEKYLLQKHYLNSPEMFSFLRSLQKLRSKGSAHRKGSDYNSLYKKFDKGDFSKTFRDILIKTIQVLNTIEAKVLKNG